MNFTCIKLILLSQTKNLACVAFHICDSVFGDSQGYYNYLKLSPAKD